MLRKCNNCNIFLKYLDNDKNDLTFLICPKCRTVLTDEKYVTVSERIEQGYFRYVKSEESIALWYREKFIDIDEL